MDRGACEVNAILMIKREGKLGNYKVIERRDRVNQHSTDIQERKQEARGGKGEQKASKSGRSVCACVAQHVVLVNVLDFKPKHETAG